MNRAARSGRSFAAREDGTITVFATMIFVLMVGIGGIAVDVMRYETQRTQLQNTLDRAVLAAASLSQELDPEFVVNNYFEVAGLEDYRLRVRVDEGLNFRRVSAVAEMEIQSIFMRMFGVRVLTSPAAGAAEERIENLEISMVLDISGSMGNSSRMTNMKPAARDFVSLMLRANDNVDNNNLVSISIIPYNGRVNVGTTLESVFTLSDEHNSSSCVRFADADFNTTVINPAVELERLAHWDRAGQNSEREFRNPHCQTTDYGAILPWEHREDVLHAQINSLYADGWTAIDLGMNWAVGLLDPAAAPAVTDLIAAGSVDADFAGRPAAYTDPETLKVVVLMTDGANTDQYDLRQPYKRGPSPIFYHVDDDQYSVYWADRGQYWIHNDDPDEWSGYWSDDPYMGDESVALSWPYLWSQYTARYIAEYFLRVPADRSDQRGFYNAIRNNSSERYAARSEGDTNLRAICTAAHAQGIRVFAIGFEAPSGGQSVMRHCASTDADYYDVDGIEIGDAFRSIANAINRLRLIQ
jgi:hypothetical protein